MSRWRFTVDLKDVFHNDALSFEEKRNAIVQRLTESAWVTTEGGPALRLVLQDLADSEDVSEFDYHWDDLYDLADIHRTWIETI